MSGLRIDVADLLAHRGARRDVHLVAEVDDLSGSSVRVVGSVDVSLHLERIPDGIVGRGDVSVQWESQCSNCLRELEETLVVHVDELFEPDPVEGETYPLLGHEIDLEQLVRDAVLLELPLAPRCSEPCGDDAGTDADVDESSDPVPDPRWAVLSELEIN